MTERFKHDFDLDYNTPSLDTATEHARGSTQTHTSSAAPPQLQGKEAGEEGGIQRAKSLPFPPSPE